MNRLTTHLFCWLHQVVLISFTKIRPPTLSSLFVVLGEDIFYVGATARLTDYGISMTDRDDDDEVQRRWRSHYGRVPAVGDSKGNISPCRKVCPPIQFFLKIFIEIKFWYENGFFHTQNRHNNSRPLNAGKNITELRTRWQWRSDDIFDASQCFSRWFLSIITQK